MKTNRINFTLKDYESGKYKVVTRDGRSVRIVYTNCRNVCPIIALVEEEDDRESFSNFTLDGKLWISGIVSNTDLYLEETIFEDGDIIISEDGFTMIFKEECVSEECVSVVYYYVLLRDDYVRYNESCLPCNTRLATEEEKIDFFSKLEKIGKKWNAEKKCIEDIKKEYQFKPFDRVLVRDDIEDLWEINFFSHKANKDEYGYRCLDCYYIYCIPYEGNEELLGTTNSPKQ